MRPLLTRRAALAAAGALVPALALAQAPVPVEAFFQHPAFADAQISPSGRHVALRVTPRTGRVQLVVIDTETMAAKAAAGFTDGDIGAFHWVNSKRLVFSVTDRLGGSLRERMHSPGLFAVDRDGSEQRQLAEVEWMTGASTSRLLNPATRFHSAMHAPESDDIWVSQAQFKDGVRRDVDSVTLQRVNTRTGIAQLPVARPGKTFEWLVDASDTPRVTVTQEGGRGAVWHLEPATQKWDRLADFEAATGAGGFEPLGFGPDGALYVSVHDEAGRATSAIHRYDFAARKVDPAPVLSAKGFDIDARLITGKGGLLGVRYLSDALGTVWFDEEYKQLQAKIDKALPATINLVHVPRRPEVPMVLVHSYSDREPGIFSLYDKASGKLVTLGRERPAIEPARMGLRDFVRYKARDGLEIPAWLTLPAGAKGGKHPLVVLVHGGPWVRGGKWEWSAESQFLASRGYAVLEPEFRGSQGYGFAHFKAGWKQWGLAMQDDVADGARWAIDKGIADPARICIAGASYGGYATLMGLVKDPGLFRCGVNWVGVTDIDLMYSVNWSDFSADYKTWGMPLLVGDRDKDAAQFKATSPLQQAERIRQPLLMAYGGKDRRVPIVHGVRLRDAVQKVNPNVEWIEYPDEGHGWYLLKDNVDFWTRVEKFLDRNIGSGAK